MAAISSKYPLGSPQEHIPMCEKHNRNINMTCEDCDEFICSQCAITEHIEHDWKTLLTAGSLRRRELKKNLSKVKEENVKEMDEKIQKAAKQIEDNQKRCDSEVSKFQKHNDEIVSKLHEIKKNLESKLNKNLERKNAGVSEKKIKLEKKKQQVMDLVQFLEEKHSTMSDFSLIDNLRDLSNLMSDRNSDMEQGNHSVRYRKGDISEELLESMMGKMFDLDDIIITETDSFQHGDKIITVIEAVEEDTCFVRSFQSGCIEQVNKRNKKGKKFHISVNDAHVADNGDLYVTDFENFSIVRLSLSDSPSTVFRTDPLVPGGICQSTEGGLLVSLIDKYNESNSELYQLDTHSRRLVRHVTLTGEVIHEYEYQEDGQTRLFTLPFRVKQNRNTDICIVNRTSKSTAELVILSFSGSLKLVYRGQKLRKTFLPTDVECDSHCNIIVNDVYNSKIHLLSPEGKFMKYLLTENELAHPFSISLYKSTLWVGDEHGLVKVFQYSKT